jgi:hypothetical protein
MDAASQVGSPTEYVLLLPDKARRYLNETTIEMNSENDTAQKKRMAKEAHLFDEIDQALLQKIRKQNPNHLIDLRNELEEINQTSFTLDGTGTLACCLTFAALRYGPRIYQKMVPRRPSSYVLDPPPMKLPLRILATGLAVGKFGAEVYASLWVGRWVTERHLDEEQECLSGSYLYNKSPQGGRTFLSKLSYFPPATGKSIVATDFCPIVQDKLRNVRHAESYELGQLLMFAENCARRQAFERRMQHVNRRHSIDQTVNSSENDDEDDDEDLAVDHDGSFDSKVEDWAEDLVKDQEGPTNPDN